MKFTEILYSFICLLTKAEQGPNNARHASMDLSGLNSDVQVKETEIMKST